MLRLINTFSSSILREFISMLLDYVKRIKKENNTEKREQKS